ncbi:hypothetical protein LTR84_000178 [Exophiala bonariae]|uniref:Nucleoside phosphorylase domain-containing protein n=1 Tax=Exophiala bonariae TaxID=1690606 RepID=A0AAV9NQB5_9EURO|nr:hypothetical protein LTR84_000178 [Exophiala bonariae]
MSARRPSRRQDFEIAIICALPLEYDAVSLLFDEFWDDDGDQYGRAAGDDNSYTTGRIGKYAVVLALLPHMGKANAAGAAAGLRSSYSSLRLALLVGTCGGVPRVGHGENDEILLGDVVISKTVVQYDFGRKYPDKFVRRNTVKGNLSKPNKDIRNLLVTFETDFGRDWLQEKTTHFLKELQDTAARKKRRSKYQYPGTAEDKLFESTYRHKHHILPTCICSECCDETDPVCDQALDSLCDDLGCNMAYLVGRKRLEMKKQLEQSDSNEAQYPAIFIGPIASGDQVMKSGEDRDRIAQRENVIAFEMEGAGIWEEVPCIVIKGVCDYADCHKSKKWQNFAAATAASASKAILLRYVQTDKLAIGDSANRSPSPAVAATVTSSSELKIPSPPVEVPRNVSNYVHHQSSGAEIRRKLVIVGDGGIGKTCLLVVFNKELCKLVDNISKVYVPTVYENYVADIEVDGKALELELWDTAGQENYDRLRPLSYPDTHVVLVAFSIDSPDTLDNVQEKVRDSALTSPYLVNHLQIRFIVASGYQR